MVRQRHLARQGDVPASNQSDLRDRLMQHAQGPGRDQPREVAGEAGDHTGMTTSRPSGCKVRNAHIPAAYVLNERQYFS
jgi:hypothetical protein